MVSTVYFFLCQLLQLFQELFRRWKFNTGRTSRRKNSIILTPKLNLSTEEYKAGHPLHNKSFIDFTDLFESVKLISQNISFWFFSEVLIFTW